MSLLELIIYLSVTATLLGTILNSSVSIVRHAEHLAHISRLAQQIQSEYTISSWRSASQLFTPLPEVETTPNVIRFNQGESTTPSSIQLRDSFKQSHLTLSIRGKLSLISIQEAGVPQH